MKPFYATDECILSDVRQRVRVGAVNPSFILADSRRLPFRDDTFDFVVSSDMLEHVPEPRDRVLSEMLRVTKWGIAFSFPERHNPAVDFYARVERNVNGILPSWYVEHTAVRLPRAAEVEDAIHREGATILAHRRYQGLFAPSLMAVCHWLITSKRLGRPGAVLGMGITETAPWVLRWFDLPPLTSHAYLVAKRHRVDGAPRVT